MPFLAVGFDESVGGCAGGAADVAGIDEHDDHHRDFFLSDEIVHDVERFVFAFAIDVSLAILDDEKSGWNFGIVLRGDINPVIALHAVVDFAGVRQLFGELAGGHIGMLVGIGRIDRHVVAAAEFFVRMR